MAEEYERQLNDQLWNIEHKISSHSILLQTSIKLEKVKFESFNVERRLLSKNVLKIAKQLDGINISQHKSETDVDSELNLFDKGVIVLTKILQNALKSLKDNENKLRLELEKIKNKTACLNGKKLDANNAKQIKLAKVAGKKVAEVTNLKWLQGTYFRCLKAAIVTSELCLGSLTVFLQKERRFKPQLPLNTSMVNNTIRLFFKCAAGNDKWYTCISHSLKDFVFTDTINNDTKRKSMNNLNKLKTLFDNLTTCSLLECAEKTITNKTQLLRQMVQTQKEYHSSLNRQLVASQLRLNNHNSFMLSYFDPVQAQEFKSELVLKIKNFICKRLDIIEECNYIDCSTVAASFKTHFAPLVTVTSKLFGIETYLLELLSSCVKLRQKNCKLERQSAALHFRKNRFIEKHLNATNELNAVTNFKKQTEKEVFQIDSKIILAYVVTEKSDLTKKLMYDETPGYELKLSLDSLNIEHGKLENKISRLKTTLNQIFKNCEHWNNSILATSTNIAPYNKTPTQTTAAKKTTPLVAARHKIVNQKFDIQKKLRLVVTKRDFTLTQAALNFNSANVNEELTASAYSLSTDQLMVEVANLKQRVSKLRSELSKKTLTN